MFKKFVSRLRDIAQPSSFFVHRRAQGHANGAGNSRDGVRAGSRGGGEEEAWAPGRSRGHGVVEATEGGAATSKAPRATWSMCHKRGRSGSATVSAPLAPRRSSLNVIVFAAIVTDPDKGWPVGEKGGVYTLFSDVFQWSDSLIRKISAQISAPVRFRRYQSPRSAPRGACRWTASFFYNLENLDVRGKHVSSSGTVREHSRNGMATFETQRRQPGSFRDRFQKTDVIRDHRSIALELSHRTTRLHCERVLKIALLFDYAADPVALYLFVRFSRSARRWIPSVELRAKAER